MGQYRSDRVYVFNSEGVEVRNHLDRFIFTSRDAYIYEVEPVGDLEPDSDPTSLSTFRCCEMAKIVSCLWSPTADVQES